MKFTTEFEAPEEATGIGEALKRHMEAKPKAARPDELLRIVGLLADRLAPWDKKQFAQAVGLEVHNG